VLLSEASKVLNRMVRKYLKLGANRMNELLLSDDELDLIWHLPYITEKERLKAIAGAQLEKIMESQLFAKNASVSYDKGSEALALAGS
jgi:hypothetical protein